MFRRRSVALASVLRIVALVVGVLGSVLIARLGGAELKGISSAFTSANAVMFAIISFDLAHQALRRGREDGIAAAIPAAMARAGIGYFAFGLLFLVLLLVAGLPFEWFAVGAVACVISGQASIVVSGLAGPVIVAWGAVAQMAAIALGTVVLHFAGVLNADSIRLVIVIAYLAPVVLFIRPLVAASSRGPSMRVRELLVAGIPWQLARLPQALLLRLDVLVVFLVLGTASAGVYSVGLSLAMLCTIVPSQFASSALFEAAQPVGNESDRHNRRRTVVLRAGIAGLASAALLGALGWPAIWILYGADFVDAYPVMLACLLGAVSYGVMQVQSNHVRILGQARNLALSNAVGLAVMLAGFAVFIPVWGAVGAGVAFSLGCAATATVTYVLQPRLPI